MRKKHNINSALQKKYEMKKRRLVSPCSGVILEVTIWSSQRLAIAMLWKMTPEYFRTFKVSTLNFLVKGNQKLITDSDRTVNQLKKNCKKFQLFKLIIIMKDSPFLPSRMNLKNLNYHVQFLSGVLTIANKEEGQADNVTARKDKIETFGKEAVPQDNSVQYCVVKLFYLYYSYNLCLNTMYLFLNFNKIYMHFIIQFEILSFVLIFMNIIMKKGTFPCSCLEF